MEAKVIFTPKVPKDVTKLLSDFLSKFSPYELEQDSKLCLYLDEKSKAYYLTCHLQGDTLIKFTDTDASLNGEDDDDIYKLNREITEDQDDLPPKS
ncbi:MAG: hypothetical protein WBW94_10625 [Anaerolineales bacterium]